MFKASMDYILKKSQKNLFFKKLGVLNLTHLYSQDMEDRSR